MAIIKLPKRSPGNSNIIRISNVRFRYLHLFKARAFKNPDGTMQEPKFQATPLLDPSDVAHKAAIQEIKSESAMILKEVFGDDMPKQMKEYLKTLHTGVIPEYQVDGFPFASGAVKDADGFEGTFFLNTSSKLAPTVVGRQKEVLTAASGKPYPGCYGTISFTLWVLNNPMFKKRIVAELRGVQFLRDGESFAGRTNVDVEEEFDDIGDDVGASTGSDAGGEDDFLN